MGIIEKAIRLREVILKGDYPGRVAMLVGDDPELLELMTPFGTWLHVAASSGRLETVKFLLGRGLDINAVGGTYGGNALNTAASDGQLKVAEYLVSQGAEMDISSPERNPLFGAILSGDVETVTLLLRENIDASASYSGEHMHEMDAIKFAEEQGQTEIMEVLIAHRS